MNFLRLLIKSTHGIVLILFIAGIFQFVTDLFLSRRGKNRVLQAYGRRVILPARLELDREYAARRAAGSSTGRSSDSQTFAALNVEMHYDLDK